MDSILGAVEVRLEQPGKGRSAGQPGGRPVLGHARQVQDHRLRQKVLLLRQFDEDGIHEKVAIQFRIDDEIGSLADGRHQGPGIRDDL